MKRRSFLKLAAAAFFAPKWIPRGHEHLILSAFNLDDAFIKAWNEIKDEAITTILAPHPMWKYLRMRE